MSEECSYLSLSPTTAHFTAHIKRQKNRGAVGTRHPRHARKKKDRRVPLALGQTIVLCLYYLWAVLDFQRTAVDMKQLINTRSKAKLFHQGQTLITDVPRRGTSSHTRYYLMPRLVFNRPLLSRSAPGLGASLFNCLLTHRAANSASTDTMRSSFWVTGTPVHRPTLADVWSSFAGHHPHH